MQKLISCSGLAFVIMLTNGCGGHISDDQACTNRAKVACAKLDECRKNGVVDTYGNLGTCLTRVHDSCMAGAMADGTGASADNTDRCNKALPGESCQDYLQNNPVAACKQVTGSYADASSCQYSGQCKSGYCSIPTGSQCGTCKTVPAIGDPCVNTGCGPDQVCTPMKTCAAWVAVNGACDGKTQVCAPGSTCVIAMSAAAGTCQADAKTAGATCDSKRQTGPACDANAGFFCAHNNTCVAIDYVAAGAACGISNMGMVDAICTNASSCHAPDTMTPAACVANADDGAACDTAAGPGCTSPARCVNDGSGGTTGTCQLADATKCMPMATM